VYRSTKLCFVTLTSIASAVAQPPALRAGVSVEMAATSHASPMPEADREDAVVVAVTAKGTVYYGITPVSPAELGRRSEEVCRGRGSISREIPGDV